MTQTNTDYLFQFTRPAADRNVSAAPANDGDDRFGNHLSQASANSRDESAVTSRSTRGAKSTVDHGREAARHSNRVDGTRDAARTQPTEKAKPRPSKSTDNSKPASAANDNHDSRDKVESNNDDDKDDSGSTRPPKFGTVEQVVASNSPAPETCACLTTDALTAAAADVVGENPNENDAANNGQSSSAQAAASVAPAAQVSLPDISTMIMDAASTATVTSTEVAAAATETVESQLPQATPKQSADDNKTEGADSANATDSETSNTQQTAAAAMLESETDPAADTAQIAANQTAATASLPKSDQPKLPSINDESSKDDSHQDSQPDAKNEAVAQSNKPTMVPVANVAATTAGDAASGTKPNDEKSESSIKPVTSKTDTPTVAFTRLTRAGAVSRGEQAANGELPPIDPARFIGRVAKAFQTANDRGGTLQIRLSPPELGSLRLEMTVKDGVLSANLQTENANARRLLLDHLPALRDRLAEQNIRVDRFDVDVRRDGTGGQADARGSQQQAFQHQPDEPAPRRQPTPQLQPRNVVRTEPTPVAPTISDTGLNLIV
jgi:flagellar hook-length control protein FliK